MTNEMQNNADHTQKANVYPLGTEDAFRMSSDSVGVKCTLKLMASLSLCVRRRCQRTL